MERILPRLVVLYQPYLINRPNCYWSVTCLTNYQYRNPDWERLLVSIKKQEYVQDPP